ncbi:exo-alpha-sialidase [Arthrobacter sp. I2-34]|uniref:exo-alpha-sialidase n=1 Tax=Arthrobacter hankyongi TaxID=2904801 RepID=A0ABS9L725_9MICC|nr:exo-alpha-sialidase [Arthrobacter hankyongi]MCG2622474.1 exo-alpha-sialidase [Arthrobacter hankyongi]
MSIAPRYKLPAAAGLLALALAAGSILAREGPATVGGRHRTEAAAGSYTEQILAKGGDGRFRNYRIPALANLGGGVLLAAYNGRPTMQDAPGPNSILLRRSLDGGRTWTGQTVIARGREDPEEEEDIGYSDPSFVVDEETGWVYVFYVYSKDTGFSDSDYGNDDSDRDVMSAAVAVSKDRGLTWAQRLITKVVKPDGVRGTFATSGHGIQLRYGAYAGRLLQQYAGIFRTATGRTQVKAYSVYSDDHGASWQMGTPVGTRMNENKAVELSTGEVMLNSRMQKAGGARYVAISQDGGRTYGAVATDAVLIDPRNNAALVRMYPDAPQGSADAKKLLFSNAASADKRVNGTIRYSCDDGRTWPVARVFQPGRTSYSDMVALGGNRFALFYEGLHNELRFAIFDRDWLAPHCAAVSTAGTVIAAGDSGTVAIAVRNDDVTRLPAGTATVSLGGGLAASTVDVPDLAPGASATVDVAVTVPSDADAGTYPGEVLISAGNVTVRGPVTVTVRADAG